MPSTGCSANTPICPFCGQLKPVQMGIVKCTLPYLRGTFGLHITYSRNINFELISFCNSYMALAARRRRVLYQGACFFSFGGVNHLSTNIQNIVAQSTTKAEIIVVVSSCAKQGIYQCEILSELGWGTFRSARIFCDNNRALVLYGQGSYSSESKHHAIRFGGLRDWIIDKKLTVDHGLTKGQLNDILTKFLA